jgi:hypothetical protein
LEKLREPEPGVAGSDNEVPRNTSRVNEQVQSTLSGNINVKTAANRKMIRNRNRHN